ncbi:MAG: metabolite traffic protein EboE [Planctomycetes bacterium]|nr:metabolite traffic protein EboE [Planctomycetota bacterium]
MLWGHPERPGRRVRVGYCLNLHPAGDLDQLFAGLREVTVPLRERLDVSEGFGVGLYLPASVAHALDADAAQRERLAATLADQGLDPFTANAFPFGGFHADGLKRAVFEPRWTQPERLAYTLAVARVLVDVQGEDAAPTLAISTHCGRFGAFEGDEFERAAANWSRVAEALAELEERTARRVRLAFEPEPRSAANDTREWDRLVTRLLDDADDAQRARFERYLGVCLDSCHAAVEFEDEREAWMRATGHGMALGKLQYSSALRVLEPGASPRAREALFALDEARYLHQTTARAKDGTWLRVDDLPQLRDACRDETSPWLEAPEWRCHFHVPVDLEELRGAPLSTTRDSADALLDAALADCDAWGGPELGVEIETYTWDVLPGSARGGGGLVDGLEREYAHLCARLESAGWRRADGGPARS